MGADVKALRNRIKSVSSTLHLTKAMQLVASSKIRKATEALVRTRSYRAAVSDMVASIVRTDECSRSPYTTERADSKTRLIVIAGDRGLAGGYNANAFRLASTVDADEIIPIGRRSVEHYSVAGSGAEAFTLEDCHKLAGSLCKDFLDDKFGKLMMVSTRYVSVMSQVAELTQLLPLSSGATEEHGDNNTCAGSNTAIFEPNAEAVLDIAAPEYLCGMIYSAVRESFASEVAARRVAMDSATKNAQIMIDDLSLRYNRARQSAITQEITEIVAGSGL